MKTLFFNSYQFSLNAQKLCNLLGGKYIEAPTHWRANQLEILKEIKNSDVVVIWNGMEPSSSWIKKLCKNNNTPYVFIEYGVLRTHEDRHSYYLDSEGSSCESSLNGDISWLTNEQKEYAKRKIKKNLADTGFSNKGSDFILCPLQVPWDTSVYMCSKYGGNMDKFLLDVVEKFPEKQIVVTNHPQHYHPFNASEARFKNVHFENEKSTIELAQYAEMVVGINSTVLYETLASGKKTIALGECPIKSHNSNINVVYAALNRQFKKTDVDGFYKVLNDVLKMKQ
jgi:capsule polysaccharide export protein KpsC/LpsZ